MTRHDPHSRCTPLEDWPRREREAWAIALMPADPLDTSVGYALRWKSSTRQMIQNGYGRFLGWLERTGQLDREETPGARATRERVIAYRAMLRDAGLADNTIAGRLQQLANALKALDREGDWNWIYRASSRLYATAELVRDPVNRMQPPDAVIALGHDLMHAAENDRFRTPRERATLFRDGLLLAFLVHRPLRRANLVAMSLGSDLERRGDRWRLRVSAEDTKNGEPIDCRWPESLVEALERYLLAHRPVLLKCAIKKGPTSALWISRQGGRMSGDAMAFQVGERTQEEFGKPINLHTFRHIATTEIATANPAGVMDVKCVLGHASISTSEKYYNRAQMLGAGNAFQETIAKLRGKRRGGRGGRKGSRRSTGTRPMD